MSTKPLLFQIGHNKCATSALFFLFLRSHHMALHSGGRYWKRHHKGFLGMRSPQERIHDNILNGHAPLEGLERFTAFFDMEYKRGSDVVENFKRYATFARHYPNAKFLMNTRDKDDWLRSRVRHANGLYLKQEMARKNLSSDEVVAAWSSDFDRHLRKVRSFFKGEADRLLVFNTDKDDIQKLVDFAAPEFPLDTSHWAEVRSTDRIVEKKGWQDDGADLQIAMGDAA
ncbi:hypothetical protein SAMN04488037_104273 [Shimia marina]|uniref:Sulfotransferase family protein n=2 Tax=Shimia marina TaxID=321267 RepID=A0A0P1EUQ6_9RHOB|nr:hypothetical protein SHM7688_03865 [Shimia marina]SFE02588.1 hypothetical protein SAMN04488037_104273 [Shimia marina]